MTEKETINFKKQYPNTQRTLVHDLLHIGLERGMIVLVHSSLSALGWVCGGPVAVILALEEVIGPEGTLIMPTHSGDLSDPAHWENPPVPESWWQPIREETPAFDPDLTPTRMMGTVPETFRKQNGVLRSLHPVVSFSAWGKHKQFFTADHPLEYGMGEEGPLGKLYRKDGRVLLLGVNHQNNTSVHLAEYRSNYPGKIVETTYAPIVKDGKRVWQEYSDINNNAEDFPMIGEEFNKTGKCSEGQVGDSTSSFMKQRDIVDFAKEWMEKNRK